MTDNFAPVDREIAVADLPIQGIAPDGLTGTLYRNGPNPRFPAPDGHWFTGDGMLHAIEFREGTAAYRNRWVRTPKFLAEEQSGRSLFRGFGGKRPDAPAGTPDDGGVANTHILRHAGRLLALEEAHPPTVIDPADLSTRGYLDLISGPFTAHPKIDPISNEMLFFGYNAAGPFTPTIRFGTLDSSGAVSRQMRFEAPYASMVHDFMITGRHVLFPVLPLTGSMERAHAGCPPYAWEPDKGACVGILPRTAGQAAPRWFQAEACYAFHVMNAWEEGDLIFADVITFDEPPLFPRADGRPSDPARQSGRLMRWRFDLAAGTDRFTRAPLDDLAGEFPRIDDRRAGLAYRHGWFACARPGMNEPAFDGIAHLDHASGKRTIYWLPEGDRLSEPVFAPRGAEEGDGWLLTVVWRPRLDLSEVLVFEARDIGAGPVAWVRLPARVPFGFHGSWISPRTNP
jgi:carotenoid cleavage dioxygenase